ncbi:2-dehydro-3-deoxy-6-phosphogalactonate aldolase [Citreimonas salinaria]|uniref:2-keto-3-deoxy-phosphogalactonate aldolase n=1 Tax=Citreimonas salinaria TaxID=321339 RepID=A0A1H3ITY6_9RHOB|nr:2-dehydro-3-deoxy-6-phosphogalactonate aldolase [Citreimonas salinaria]SDY30354.1 2-keto-3-deoxy-phosphogalactonate aldolase [Citreimonas salinaria]
MSRNLIAILRSITPEESVEIAEALIEQGIIRIEVPLNSPDPFESIGRMIEALGSRAEIGAGTVLDVADVERLAQLGARLVVSPNCDPDVIRATRQAGLESWPGVFTATECFTALRAGATGLKLFPASLLGPEGVRALRAILPPEAQLYAVGGVEAGNLATWLNVGVTGFGLGSTLYAPGRPAADVSRAAAEIVAALRKGSVPHG